MDLLSPRKQGWVKLAQYCEVFRWPRAYAKVANFYPKGQLISNLKKWTASEQLSLVPVLHKYLCDVVAPKTDCPAAVRSCILLCRVVLMLTRIMHAGEHGITGQMLDIAVLRHLQAHQTAYGDELWILKHHLCLHLGKQFEDCGFLMATFLMERMHRHPKREATARITAVSFERGLMTDVTVQQLHDIAEDVRDGAGLLNVHAAPKALSEAVRQDFGLEPYEAVACAVTVLTQRGRRVLADDVVTYDTGAGLCIGEVHFHVQVRGLSYTLLSPWTVEEKEDPQTL